MRRPIAHPSALALAALAALLLLAAACGRKGDPYPRSDVHAEASRTAAPGG